jgi:methionine synthase II (cobalamin-independent)
MFSTLLGMLPPAEHGGDSTSGHHVAVLTGLADVGLELVTTGDAPAGPDRSPEEVVAAWLVASAATDAPVKQVLAGPYSAGRDGGAARPSEIAEAHRATIAALAAAGCEFVEVDESDALAIGVVAGERRRFADAHRRLLDGVPGIHVSLALTGGNFDGAGAATFFDLAYASFAFDLIAGPDNWRLIAAAPQDRGIVCGALDPRPNGDETPELLVWAAHYAASTAGRGIDRVGLANAPSLADGSWEVALRKLRRVAEAARLAGMPSDEMAPLLDPRSFGGRRDRPGGPLDPGTRGTP